MRERKLTAYVTVDETYPIFIMHLNQLPHDIEFKISRSKYIDWMEIDRKYWEMQHEIGEAIGFYKS